MLRSTTRARLALCQAVSSYDGALMRAWAEWRRGRSSFVEEPPESDGWFARATSWLRG